MKGSLYIGQYAKVKVFIHWTFFILISYILFLGVSMGQQAVAIGWHILFILAVFLCILFHEFGHVLAGQRLGYKTKDIIILPIGGLSRFEKLPDSPKEELIISISGPMINLLIAVLLLLVIPNNLSDFPSLEISEVNSRNFLFLLFEVNLLLGIFNLIPAFPMDGGRVFRAFLTLFISRVKATKIASAVGTVFAIVFILLGVFFNPFLIFIGLFIIFSASNESSIVNISALLEGHTAGELVMHKFDLLDENTTLAEASKEILDGQSTSFAVISAQKTVIGTISREVLLSSLKSLDLDTPLSKIMNPSTKSIPSNIPLKDLFIDKILDKNNLVPVTENGEIIGMINLENILEFIAFKKATSEWKKIIN
ncbi:site-2 protease family protein [Algoriphagus marinus]|uniref:site-2 protease family protein n=1 Tax=Algoriphagus marinus TaxID=1925762 RepID=UPI00094BB629|nr:site-2 protease family protein [Algoriphagus marinus]